MFIKINANETVDCNEAIINTDQVTWINVKDRRIKLTDGTDLFVVSKSELDRIIEEIRAEIYVTAEKHEKSEVEK